MKQNNMSYRVLLFEMKRGEKKMAELPEIVKLAVQMRDTLCGKSIKTIALLQEKCTSISSDEFQKRTVGARIKDIRNKGKWIVIALQ